jgi:hypothetical protein
VEETPAPVDEATPVPTEEPEEAVIPAPEAPATPTPLQAVAGAEGEVPDEAAEPRRQVVAGASGEAPDAALPAAGATETIFWIILSMAFLLLSFGANVRAAQLRRE